MLYEQIIEDLKKKGKEFGFKDIERVVKRAYKSEWAIGFNDRGNGHGDYAITTKKKGYLIAKCEDQEIANHICELHNRSIKKEKPSTYPSRRINIGRYRSK